MSTNEKCAEVTTQLQVDEFILDYLLFHSIQAQLLDSQTSSSLPDADTSREYHRSNIALQLVDCKLADSRLDEIVAPGLISSIAFLAIFHHAHADYQADADLQYRLRLLKFVVFFTRRKHTSSSTPGVPILEQLHLTRQDHARIFRLKDDGLENPNLPDLTEYLAPSAGSMRTRQEKISDKVTLGAASSPPVSLLDTLPSFMALSATHNAMQETSITDTWMRLAAGYMAQAVVEQYLVYESRSSEVLQEAFAWGFDSESTAEEGSDEWMINTMFFGEEEVIAGWDEVRDAHMRALIPPMGRDLQDHLRTMLLNELPSDGFEQRILSFLEGLLQSQPNPILGQVETGKLEGLSRREVQEFQQRVGLAGRVATS